MGQNQELFSLNIHLIKQTALLSNRKGSNLKHIRKDSSAEMAMTGTTQKSCDTKKLDLMRNPRL